jgi:hypothetical protein
MERGKLFSLLHLTRSTDADTYPIVSLVSIDAKLRYIHASVFSVTSEEFFSD